MNAVKNYHYILIDVGGRTDHCRKEALAQSTISIMPVSDYTHMDKIANGLFGIHEEVEQELGRKVDLRILRCKLPPHPSHYDSLMQYIDKWFDETASQHASMIQHANKAWPYMGGYLIHGMAVPDLSAKDFNGNAIRYSYNQLLGELLGIQWKPGERRVVTKDIYD